MLYFLVKKIKLFSLVIHTENLSLKKKHKTEKQKQLKSRKLSGICLGNEFMRRWKSMRNTITRN